LKVAQSHFENLYRPWDKDSGMRLTLIDLGDIYNGTIEHGKVRKNSIPMKENQTLAALNYLI
jgi:hypothetical protein